MLDTTPGNFGPGFTTTADVDVSNRLIGPQIGVSGNLSAWSSSNFDVKAFAKLGYLQNHAESDIASGGTVPAVVTAASNSDTNWTTMVELGVAGAIHVSGNMDIELGYQLLYFDKLASSTATLGNSVFSAANIPATSVGYDSAFYHGGTVKAVWRF